MWIRHQPPYVSRVTRFGGLLTRYRIIYRKLPYVSHGRVRRAGHSPKETSQIVGLDMRMMRALD